MAASRRLTIPRPRGGRARAPEGNAVDWGILFQWEWLIIELIVLGVAIVELISVRRAIREDREQQREG